MRRHAFCERQRGISYTHFVRELLGLVINLFICTESKTDLQCTYFVGNLLNPCIGNQQQREQNDDHENNDGERLGKPPCQRAAKHIAEQTSRILQQRHVETLGVGRERRIEYGADGPQNHGPPRHHTHIAAFALGLIYEAECHQRQKDRQDDAHQTKQAGSQGVEHPAEHALYPEPFRSAEHYRENHQNKTCDITSVPGQNTHHRRRLDRVHDLGLAGTRLARGPFAAGFRIGRCCSCHNGHDFTHWRRHDMALPRIAHIF